MHWLAQWANLERTRLPFVNSLTCNSTVIWVLFTRNCAAALAQRAQDRCANATIGIKNCVVRIRHRQYTSFDKFHRKLARMLGLLWVIRLDVGNIPQAGFPFL